MVLEIAMLTVIPGRESEFETAFQEARPIISAADGFESLDLYRSVETANCYALHVVWNTLEDHTEDFRKSPGYEEWKRLLHPFYDPFPSVEHYQPVQSFPATANRVST